MSIKAVPKLSRTQVGYLGQVTYLAMTILLVNEILQNRSRKGGTRAKLALQKLISKLKFLLDIVGQY